MGDVLLELMRVVVLMPAAWLWRNGWWARLVAICYVAVPPVVAGYLLFALLPPMVPWGWLLVAVLAIWAVNLVEGLVELIRAGVRRLRA